MEFGFLFFKDDFNLVIFVFDLKPTILLEPKRHRRGKLMFLLLE